MIETFKRNWRVYLMEAAGLAGFVLGAGLLTIFLEHPDFPAMQSSFGGTENAIWRRVPLGLLMGAYIALVIYLFGEKSGAHINPATTWSFYRLGKIDTANSRFLYIGAICRSDCGGAIVKSDARRMVRAPARRLRRHQADAAARFD
jgi:aquaporin Z